MKRSVRISHHKTSISMEEEFWKELKNFAIQDAISLNALISRIDAKRTGNLSSALRVYVLQRIKKAS